MIETKINGESLDILSENISKLKELFPAIVTEDKIDFEKLKEVLGKYTEDSPERYNFTWKGKSAALRLAQTSSTGTLRPSKEESKNWDTTENLFIEGDNLEVLKLLQKSYYGKIKMIYIDPPYNTGKEFVYPDDYKDNLINYLEITGQFDKQGKKISTNTETRGRYHTNWLNMMYPRLKLSRSLLRDDGVIFISIDDNEIENLKKICNEIFGEENFIGNVIWNSTKSVTNTAIISVSHTHNLIFAKDKNYFVKNRSEFRLPESGEGFSNPDNDSRGPWKADPFQVGGWRPNQQYEVKNPKTGKIYLPNKGCSWKNDYHKFQELLKDGRIIFGSKGDAGPQRKRFLSEAKDRGKVAKTIWDDIGTTTHGTKELQKLFSQRNIFDNPKPVGLIKRMISLGTINEGDIVLDFFAGSGTTADAVFQINLKDAINRKFILIQLPELTDKGTEAYEAGYFNICEITKERIRRAGDKIVSEMNQNGQTSLDSKPNNDLDIGFKVFKLDSSNLAKWDPEYDNLEQTLLDSVENLVPGRNEMDLVYEIMLKYGIDLTLPIEEYPIQDKKFYSIGFGALIICLDDKLTSNLASEIIKLKDKLSPEVMRVVFKDNGFASDSDKTNIKETLKTNGIEEFVTI